MPTTSPLSESICVFRDETTFSYSLITGSTIELNVVMASASVGEASSSSARNRRLSLHFRR